MKSLRYAAAIAAFAPLAAYADATPNAYSFTDKTNAAVSSVVTSAAVTIGGIDAPATVSVAGGSYSVGCTSTYLTTAGSISNGQKVCVRHTAAATPSTAVNTTLTIGGVADTFTSTTVPPDTTPTAFIFIDETGAAPNAVVTSKPATIGGINTAASVSVSGGSYSVGCTTPYTSADGTINNGQTICLRNTAAATAGASVVTRLTIGGLIDNFSITTADSSTSKSSMLPYGAGTGTLRLFNPLKPFSLSNPVSIFNGFPGAAFDEAQTGYSADVSGTVISNIRGSRLALVRASRVLVADLTVGQNNRIVTISSITDACAVDTYIEDLQLASRSRLMLLRKGSDGNCHTGDDVRTVIPVNAPLSEAGVSPAGLQAVQVILGTAGQITGFLTIEGSPQLALTHRDASFANPVVMLGLANSGLAVADVGFSTSFLALTPQGQTAPRLYRYNNAANGTTLSAPLYNFLNAGAASLDAAAAYDGSNLYYSDGNRVLRTPLNAASTADTRLAGSLASGQLIQQLHLSAFASTRLVFSATDGLGNGGVYSLLKTATGATPLLLQSSSLGTGLAQLVTVASDFAYIHIQDFSTSTVRALRIGVDGNGASSTANAYWAGIGLMTRYDLSQAAIDNNLSYVLKASKNGSSDTLAVVDPATGAANLTLGILSSTVPMVSAFGLGDGRYGGLSAVIRRSSEASDTDGYFYDAQTANSLKAIAGVVGKDDYYLP